jgi:stage III sporulation protein AB
LGVILARNLGRRQEILRELQVALQLLETEITYTATPLPEAFRRVADKTRLPTRLLFNAARHALVSTYGVTASEAWDAGVTGLLVSAPLEEEDLAVLRDFGQGLGQGDRADQVKKLELARAQLRKLEEVATENRLRQAKVWQVMGFLGGLTIILLLY